MEKFPLYLIALISLGFGACAWNDAASEDDAGNAPTDGGLIYQDAGAGSGGDSPRANDVPDGGDVTDDDDGDEDAGTTGGGSIPGDALGETTTGAGRAVQLTVSASDGQTIESVWGDLVPVNEGGVGWDPIPVNSAKFRMESDLLDGVHRINGRLVGGKYLCGYNSCEDTAPVIASGVTVTAILKDGGTIMTIAVTCEDDPESGECVGNLFLRIPSG